MGRLHGTGLGRGMALGAAAVVRMRNGFPLLPPIPARIAELLSKRKLTETPDVILVAEDYRIALDIASSLRWGRVVGIVAGHASPDAPIASFPAVVNVPLLLDAVQDDMLIVVDADHDLVIADPDGMEVAHYQAEREKIAPRRRLFLDDVHLTAETIDGRGVLVMARAQTDAEITMAVEVGADTVYVPSDAPLLPVNTDDVAQRQNLLSLIDRAAGKPLLLADEYALSSMLLLEAALRSDLMIAIPLWDHLDGLGLGELGAELNEARADCLANEMDCELPKLAVRLTLDRMRRYPDLEEIARFTDRLAVGGAIRIVLEAESEPFTEEDLALLDLIIAAANATMLPVIIAYEESAFENLGDNALRSEYDAQIRFLVGVGVSAIITRPEAVSAMKAVIRNLNFSECREAVSETLSRKEA